MDIEKAKLDMSILGNFSGAAANALSVINYLQQERDQYKTELSQIRDKLIAELEELAKLAHLRATDLRRDELLRAKSEATADAYGYCALRLRTLQK